MSKPQPANLLLPLSLSWQISIRPWDQQPSMNNAKHLWPADTLSGCSFLGARLMAWGSPGLKAMALTLSAQTRVGKMAETLLHLLP